ncbi:sensor histidine kinase [Serinibacter arcticus]|nr:histidine kinase dimerization/phosphoacceptor domain-containing protein [Serinibacter arcticus]
MQQSPAPPRPRPRWRDLEPRTEEVRPRSVTVLRDAGPVIALGVFEVVLWRSAVEPPPAWLGVLVLGPPLLTALGRHHRPVAAFAATAAGAVLAFVAAPTSSEAVTAAALALVLCLVPVVERASNALALAAVGVTAVVSLAPLLRPEASTGNPVLTLLSLAAAAVLLGRNRRGRRSELALLRERADTAERTQLALARTAVADERRRIAREVHDIVSHNIAVMTNLADGATVALRRVDPPARTLAAIEAIAGTGREAMAEMHALLGVLREPDEADEADEPSRPPAPASASCPTSWPRCARPGSRSRSSPRVIPCP